MTKKILLSVIAVLIIIIVVLLLTKQQEVTAQEVYTEPPKFLGDMLGGSKEDVKERWFKNSEQYKITTEQTNFIVCTSKTSNRNIGLAFDEYGRIYRISILKTYTNKTDRTLIETELEMVFTRLEEKAFKYGEFTEGNPSTQIMYKDDIFCKVILGKAVEGFLVSIIFEYSVD